MLRVLHCSLLTLIFLTAQDALAQEPSAPADPTTPASEPSPPAGEPSADANQDNENSEGGEDAALADGEEPTGEAEDADAGSSNTVTWWDEMLDTGALGYLVRGGVFMWPILIMGIIALGVIIERYRSLKMLGTNSDELRSEVETLLKNDQAEEAIELCDREQGPVPAILGSGLRKYLVLKRLNYDAGRIEEQVVKSMDDYSVHIVAALERHLPVLATISSAAPMLGFLGTVGGMIVAFDEINARIGEGNIVQLAAGGISQALLTTCFGLIVGIPAFMAFNYFTSVINRFVLDVEEAGTELIESVTLQMALDEREQPDSSRDEPSAESKSQKVG